VRTLCGSYDTHTAISVGWVRCNKRLSSFFQNKQMTLRWICEIRIGQTVLNEVKLDSEAAAIERAMEIIFMPTSEFNASENVKDSARNQLKTKGCFSKSRYTAYVYFNAVHQE
jgi:hypothetical protein